MPNNLNVLVLGQTGSGKSSLINYLGSLAADKALESGVGKPVTAEGDFTTVTVPLEGIDNVTLTLADSWGLEPDKADRWEKLISRKLAATLDYTAMISGVIYCLSYNQARIQDFEIGMLKKLFATGYKIVIALTNADVSGYEARRMDFRNRLAEQLPEFAGQYAAADICSVQETKIGAPAAAPFGKDELLRQLKHDWRSNFNTVFLKNLDDWYSESKTVIEAFHSAQKAAVENLPVFLTQTTVNRLKTKIETEAKRLSEQIFEKIKSNIQNVRDVTEGLAGSFDVPDVKFWSWDLLLLAIPAPPILAARILFAAAKGGWMIFRMYRNRKKMQFDFAEVLSRIVIRLTGEVDSCYKRVLLKTAETREGIDN
ncbi:MAG: GTPase domain-containing protein [Planctomycetaceae bacterium]|jgi:energy-coupling factor transporter ATP-binding protein EcfA2|nr:GTPase domain-containing protein [Planctomycetaceae bacterium]